MTPQEIKNAMLETDLRTDEMAKVLGIHPHTLIKWERGERKPNHAAVRLIELILYLYRNFPPVFDRFVQDRCSNPVN